MKKLFIGIIDLLFPSHCLSCGNLISFSEKNFCKECFQNIEFCMDSCPLCSGEMIDGKCSICRERKFFIKRNYSIALYKGRMKDLLHHYKFYSRKRLSSHIAGMVNREIEKKGISADFITAVPINKRKMYKRGYNQSEVIARKISKVMKVPYIESLRESSVNIEQKKLGYNERFLNTIGKFTAINMEYFSNKRILIVDDIFTTGATINECGRILRESGAREVNSITIARADNRNTL